MRTLKKFSLSSDGLPTRGAVAAYQRDGVVCLEGAFNNEWVQQGRRAVAAAIGIASDSPAREDHKNDGESGTFFLIPFYGDGCRPLRNSLSGLQQHDWRSG